MTDLETVKELAGTLGMDSPSFYNALDRVLKKFEEQQELIKSYEEDLRDLYKQNDSLQNEVQADYFVMTERQREDARTIMDK